MATGIAHNNSGQSTVTFDDKIFHTEVSNITSLRSKLTAEDQLRHIRERNEHLDATRKLHLQNSQPRSALKYGKIERNTSSVTRDSTGSELQNNSSNGDSTNNNQLSSPDEDDSEEEYNFDSDDADDCPFDHSDSYIPRQIGHTKPSIENDITVKTYRKACRKLGVVPHSAILRNLVEQEMNVRYGSIGETGAKACAIALVYNDRVCEVDLTGNNIGDKGTDYIAEVLSYNSYITSLTLSENAISLKGLACLCEQISSNRYISYLDISKNNFGDSGATYIGNMLLENDTLLDLNLSNNALLEAGGIILGNALVHNNTLEILDISWNHMRMKGVSGLCSGIKDNKGLKDLRAGWNGFYLQGCSGMGEALDSNKSLEYLGLENNRITLDCLRFLMAGLKNNKTLKGLNLTLNPIGTDGAMLILQTLEDCPGCAINSVNIESQTVYNHFLQLLEKVQENRILDITYGTVIEQSSEVTVVDDTINDDPLIVLMEYMRQNNMRLLDLFVSLDADGSKSLSREEFKNGLLDVNLPLSSQSLDKLLDELDIDGDGEVDFGELMEGQKEFRRRISRIQANKSNNSEDNKFTRIQKKVKAILKAREAVKIMKKMALRKGSVDTNGSNESLKMASIAMQWQQNNNKSRRNSIFPNDTIPEIPENEETFEPDSIQRSNSVLATSTVPLGFGAKPRRSTVSR